jgi:hypothetical protein
MKSMDSSQAVIPESDLERNDVLVEFQTFSEIANFSFLTPRS